MTEEDLKIYEEHKRKRNERVYRKFGEEYETHDMVCRFAYNGKGWTYSLYSSNPEIDCSEIAKQYGGGGHRGAAGFKLDHCIFGVPKRTFLQKLKELFK